MPLTASVGAVHGRACFKQSSVQRRAPFQNVNARPYGRCLCRHRLPRTHGPCTVLASNSTLTLNRGRGQEEPQNLVPSAAGAELQVQQRGRAAQLCVRQHKPDELWELARLHCATFYPNAGAVCSPLLRLDRFLSLQMGPQCEVPEWRAFYRCLVAAYGTDEQVGFLPGGFRLPGWFQQLLKRPGQRLVPTAASWSCLCGAITVDSLGRHLPESMILQLEEGTPRDQIDRMACGGIAYVSNLAVAFDMRRRGVGMALLHAAEQMAGDWGCLAVALHCNPTNVAAYELYKCAGYRTVAVEPPWYAWWQGQSRLEVMTKSLKK